MGLCILGFATAMIVIPIFPEMLHAIELKHPQLRGDELNNVSSGYFNSFLGVGEAIGPICASVLTHNFGFRSSEDILGSVILLYCILFFLLCGRFTIFNFAKEEDNQL
jgi:MFS family permease